MTDKWGHDLKVGDAVFYYFDLPEKNWARTDKILVKIVSVGSHSIEIKRETFWLERVPNWRLEYASTEKLFLWKLEN
jgi:hypothetical protein